MKVYLSLIVSLFVLTSCSSSKNSEPKIKEAKTELGKKKLKKREDLITKTEANRRFGMIKSVKYDINIELVRNAKNYKGQVILNFETVEVDGDLRVDFTQGEIQSVQVNGKTLSNHKYDGYKLNVPSSFTKEGQNQIIIKFSRAYSNDGRGLHKFTDPIDQNEYFYTNFEPFSANRFIPCFDQPDLRANYKLQVTAPSDWKVIANKREEKIIEISDSQKQWLFPETENFSTYVFALHAGPYVAWEDSYKEVPLRLLARKSMAQHVKPKPWFTVTKQGFEFFENYFGVKYPYSKYDQILVPDFNAGAMENVGAVTFNDSRYIFRSTPSLKQSERRASVILHELAHMWFGNLVTMKWWNGLWLNESFASYMASLALYQATEYKGAWQSFYNGFKAWAYWEDGLVTTHPIETQVVDTSMAFSNFDGITYGKGASVLKQLNFLLGGENFRKGVSYYLKTYANSNTKLSDFFGSLEKVSRRDLSDWTKNWLQTSGHNRVSLDYKCSQGLISEFKIQQSNNNDVGVLRTHRSIISLFKKQESNRFDIYKELVVRFSGKTTYVDALKGETCPDFAYPNFKDHAFFKVDLDQNSLENATFYINYISHSLTRNMVWSDIWDMVRVAKFSLKDYLKMVLTHIEYEQDYRILNSVLSTVQSDAYYYLQQYKQDSSIDNLKARLEKFYYSNLIKSPAGSEKQKIWFDGFVKISSTSWALKKLEELYLKKLKLKSFDIDQDRIWNIVTKLSSFNWSSSQDYIAAETLVDQSDRGLKSKLHALSSYPKLENKNKWYGVIIENKEKLNLAKLTAIMQGFFHPHQKENIKGFSNRFYDDLISIYDKSDLGFINRFTKYFAPHICEEKENLKLKKFISDYQSLTKPVMKKLRVAHQENQRCIKIVDFDQGK